jgi:acyl transferase domain-containing protein/NADPH:quinone reductase-like Zn-dependent oxidoreductase/short-subunit dehydrogenase/acyl carrier protein
MSETRRRLGSLSPAKLALAVRALRERAGGSEALQAEPIAIVGLACRFPGAPNPEAFWTLLAEGREAIREVPADRWPREAFFDADPERAGTAYVRRAGFLDDVWGFDAGLFGVTPREALAMDPQQRLLLELTVEALEDAAMPWDGLRGARGGVFVGMSNVDYAQRALHPEDLARIDAHSGTGIAPSIGAGRLSFFLGMHGPSVALDTACSSSLVAMHLAASALRSEECDLALAGGVNLILDPECSVYLSRLRALSRDGRCKAFDASADGYVRGEGAGLVVLKRLSDALRDGDRIRAVMRGSAVNHDGPSSGLTVPHGPAQEAVLTAAIVAALVSPAEVAYVEAHGTGTALGDPIELRALARVFGCGRDAARPLRIGGVKTNIGHLEAAAGVAGVIKTVLALEHGVIPPQLHFRTPTPHVPWGELPLEVVVKETPWPAGRRIAGVSSFGLSGTNAHVVLEQAPAVEDAPAPTREVSILAVSAATESALRETAGRWAEYLEGADDGETFANVCATSVKGRAAQEHRVVLAARTASEARAVLQRAARGEAPGARVRPGARPRIAFAFTGQGSQYAEMGRRLFASEPEFRAALEHADGRLRAPLGGSLLEMLFDSCDGAGERLAHTRITQPAIVALQLALVAVLRSIGVRPSIVLGHSVGEISAAAAAGLLDIDEALDFAAERGRVLGELPPEGAMAATAASPAQIDSVLRLAGGELTVAGYNAPQETILSGGTEAVESALRAFAAQNVGASRLPVSHAFHSALMAPALPALGAAAARLRFRTPEATFVSTLTGGVADQEAAAAGYWVRQAREAVQLAGASRTLESLGCDVVVEIGPRPVLLPLLRRNGVTARRVPTLDRGGDDVLQLARAIAELASAGAEIDWGRFYGRRPRVAVPGTFFERVAYRLEPTRRPPKATFERTMSVDDPAFLSDHRVAGLATMPLTGYLDMALAAARAWGEPEAALTGIVVHEPLVLPAGMTRVVRVVGSVRDGVRVESVRDEGEATVHFEARLGPRQGTAGAPAFESLQALATNQANAALLYEEIGRRGLSYGPAFRALVETSRSGAGALGRLRDESPAGEGVVSPGALDAGLQLAATLGGPSEAHAILPVAADRFEWVGGAVPRWAFWQPLEASGSEVRANLIYYGADGQVVGTLSGLRGRSVADARLRALRSAAVEPLLHERTFEALGPPPRRPTLIASALLVGSPGGLRERLVQELKAAGVGSVDTAASLDAGLGAGRPEVVITLCVEAQEPWRLALETARALDRAGSGAELVVVTQGGVPDEVDGDPEQAMAFSFARSLRAERTGRPMRLIDLDSGGRLGLAAELTSTAGTAEVVLRGGVRLAPRLTAVANRPRVRRPEGAHRLETSAAGDLARLVHRPFDRQPPGPGRVEIEVEATGLNFRDVLTALGLYPGAAGALGQECAGTIAAIGAGVTDLRAGDRVVALASGSCASHVTVASALALPWPAALDAASAAALPVASLTALYALESIAELRAGQTVLIHAGAGGVGLAAIARARRLGARVFATAGSRAKRRMLLDRGVEAVFSSRESGFGPGVKAATGGRGVDVVVNSLSGDFIREGLTCLAEGGHFVELGKRGIWSDEQVAVRRPDVRYRVFDLGQESAADAGGVRERFARLLAETAADPRSAPVTRTFAAEDAPQAFRAMADGRHVGKLVLSRQAPGFSSEASYLITGGFGGIGQALACFLADRGAGRIVLLGRRGPAPENEALLRELAQRGITVVAMQGDVASPDDVRRALETASAPGWPLRGVFHAAGVLDDALAAELTPERVRAVLRPKVEGATLLDRLTRDTRLEHFVLLSSLASIAEAPGQAAYAAANAFLDALAWRRRREGLAATVVNFGPWGEVGMTSGLSAAAWAAAYQRGIRPLAPETALLALESALERRLTQVAIADGLPRPSRSEGARAPAASGPVVRTARDLEELVAREVRRVTGLRDDAPLDIERPLRELGLDSLLSVELRNVLATALGCELPSTLVFDHPTVSALVLRLSHDGVANATEPAARSASAEPIAIVGLACRLPGADDPEAFWSLLRDGRQAISDVPADRWDLDAWYDADPEAPGKSYARQGGFVQGLDRFDARFFGIAPREAETLDPQHRLLLELSWEALEGAGIPAESLMGRDAGVFVGLSSADWSRRGGTFAADPRQVDAWAGTGSAASIAAGRIAYTFGLAGPTVTIDTACSSSLVAVHLACQSLRSGEASLALAAGVNAILAPEGSVFLSKARSLSPNDRCRPFDAAANGYVRGEGGGVIVLKRLSDAVRDHDPILAVIRGSAVNQDGRSAGLTAPNGVAQEAVLRRALSVAGAAPTDIAYVEAHGTGTPLGDPIELRALAAVLGEGRSAEEPLVVGSLKGNIGHLEAAAGIAGLIKAVLVLAHAEAPRQVGFEHPNPHVPWNEIPVHVPRDTRPIARGGLAGVSSFGLSGTNAHVILEGAPRDETPRPAVSGAAARVMLPVSARSPRALADYAARLADLLESPEGRDLGAVARASGRRRAHHPRRAAVVAADAGAAVRALRALAKRESAVGLLVGGPPRSRRARVRLDGPADAEMLRAWGVREPDVVAAESRAPDDVVLDGGASREETLATLYVAGVDLDWAAIYPQSERLPRLPSYPWDRERFWIDPPVADPSGRRARSSDARHPLLGERLVLGGGAGVNVFESTLDPSRLVFLQEHRVLGVPVLPAAAYLELATAGGERLLETSDLIVEDLNFERPLVLDRRRRVQTWFFDDGPAAVRMRIASESEAGDWIQHAHGRLRRAETLEAERVEVEDLGEIVEAAEVYARLAARGLEYGPRFRGVQSARRQGGKVVTQIAAPRGIEDVAARIVVLDSLFHGAALFDVSDALPVPQRIRRVRILGRLPTAARGVSTRTTTGADFALVREDGNAGVVIEGLELGLEPAARLAQVEYEAADRPADVSGAGRLLVVGEGALAIATTAAAESARVPTRIADLAEASVAIREERPTAVVLNVGTVPAPLLGGDLEAVTSALAALIEVVRAAEGVSPAPRLLVTIPAPEGTLTAAVRGFVATLAFEHPEMRPAIMTADPADASAGEALLAEALGAGREPAVAWRAGRRWVRRLREIPFATEAALGPAFLEGTVLITGGLGALGLAVADRLVARGARSLLLASRRGERAIDLAAEGRIAAWREAGAIVRIGQADMGRREEAERLFDEAFGAGLPIGAVLHLAGVLDDGVALRLDAERLSAVLAPKLGGALILDEVTRRRPVAAFVLFSSVAGVIGSPGQAAYAAANAGLDAIAEERRAAGFAGHSIAWSAWSETGLATASEARRRGVAALGGLATEAALAAFERVLGMLHPSVVVLPATRLRFESLGLEVPPLLSAIERPLNQTPGDARATRCRLVALPPDVRRSAVQEYAHERAAEALGLTRERLAGGESLTSLGLDSLMALALRNRLIADLGDAPPLPVLLDGATVDDLAAAIERILSGATPAPAVVEMEEGAL